MIAKGTGYVKGAGASGRLGAHLKYVEHRAKSERESRDDRRIFDKENDVVSRSDAREEIMDNTHSQVAYHKMILSPGEGETVTDWREWTREVMGDLEERQGKNLHWVAVHHDNTDNEHVHIVLAGRGENAESGKSEVVKMYAPDYQFLRESGREHSGYEQEREVSGWTQEFDEREAQELGVQSGGDRAPLTEGVGRGDRDDKGDFDR